MTTKLKCDRSDFRGTDTSAVRWLEWDADFEMARQFWPTGIPLTRQMWEEARDAGYRYCAVVEGKEIVALAAEYRFSDAAWMLAAVRTSDRYRRRGYGKMVTSFVTKHILDSGRIATCEARDDNLAMIRTAESIGYRRSEQPAP
jgi:RimJ/RimL family protein N-acetyltransferase